MLTYFLQVNLCWLMFYGLYWALLSRETFFKLNRIYLIISLLFGLIVPFATEYMSQMEEVVEMPIVQISQPMAQSIEVFQENIEVNMVRTAETWNLWQILRGCYVVGVLWVLMRFLIGLLKIWKLYQRGFKEKNNDFTLVYCEDLQTPFSFFKWIFIDKTLYDAAALGQILEHEKAHVHQKHSFDIVGIEILRGVFWMSPLVHLYARSLRNVHEYLADAAVLENTEKKQYGRLLISQSANTSGLIIANHFNFSQLKKRIIMMSRNRSQRKALIKYTLAAPLFLLSILAFTVPNSPLVKNTEGVSNELGEAIENADNSIKNIVQKGQNSIDTTKKSSQSIIDLDGSNCCFIKPERLKKQIALNTQKGYVIKSFKLKHYRNRYKANQQLEIVENYGAVFNSQVLALIANAELGDDYHFNDIRVINQEINDEFIWGQMTFTVSNNNSDFFAQLMTLIDSKGQAIHNNFKIDFHELKNIKGIKLRPEKEIKYENTVEIMIAPKVVGDKIRIMKTKDFTFNNEALAFINSAEVGESLSFNVRYSGKGIRGTAYSPLKIVDYSQNSEPYLILPRIKVQNDISLSDLKQVEYLIAKSIEKGEPKTLKILKFSVLLNPSFHSKKEVKVVVNKGANFSEDVKTLLASAEEGDEIFFTDNEVFDKDKNSLVATRGLIFRVKTK